MNSGEDVPFFKYTYIPRQFEIKTVQMEDIMPTADKNRVFIKKTNRNSIVVQCARELKRMSPEEYTQATGFSWAMRLALDEEEVKDNLWYYQKLVLSGVCKVVSNGFLGLF